MSVWGVASMDDGGVTERLADEVCAFCGDYTVGPFGYWLGAGRGMKCCDDCHEKAVLFAVDAVVAGHGGMVTQRNEDSIRKTVLAQVDHAIECRIGIQDRWRRDA